MKRFSLRYVSSSSPVVRVLSRLLPILGCALLVCSIMLPFCVPRHYGPEMHVDTASNINRIDFPFDSSFSTYYWSFRSLYTDIFKNSYPWPPSDYPVIIASSPVNYWLSDCWFHDTSITGLGLSSLFVVMFTVRILTLAFGVASIFIRRIALALVPVILCLTIIHLMIYASAQLSTSDYVSISFQPGYWLTFPSILLFLTAFMLRLLTKK